VEVSESMRCCPLADRLAPRSAPTFSS
jgi:hypothetical protein